jgi:hypothetical protein
MRSQAISPASAFFFDDGLKLVTSLLQIVDQLIGLHFEVSLHLTRFGFKRRQSGVHLVNPLLCPIQVQMHAAPFWHHGLHAGSNA